MVHDMESRKWQSLVKANRFNKMVGKLEPKLRPQNKFVEPPKLIPYKKLSHKIHAIDIDQVKNKN